MSEREPRWITELIAAGPPGDGAGPRRTTTGARVPAQPQRSAAPAAAAPAVSQPSAAPGKSQPSAAPAESQPSAAPAESQLPAAPAESQPSAAPAESQLAAPGTQRRTAPGRAGAPATHRDVRPDARPDRLAGRPEAPAPRARPAGRSAPARRDESDLAPWQWVLVWLVLAALGTGFAVLLWNGLTTPPR